MEDRFPSVSVTLTQRAAKDAQLEIGPFVSDTKKIQIYPTGPVRASVRPPGSKSITNRALVCAALAEGASTLHGALNSEDTQVMIAALRKLGLSIEHNTLSKTIRVEGQGGLLPVEHAELDVANSGTTVRFLTALVTLGKGHFRLDGTSRMCERPISDLVEALAQLGANVRCEKGSGCPPVVVEANQLPGGTATVAGNLSSQYLSGLLMVAPYAQSPVELLVRGELVSKPYVEMTRAVMAAFGVEVETEASHRRFVVSSDVHYQGRTYSIEPDASAASYFFAAAAVTQGEVTVEGLSRNSLQGDVAFCECLRQMGCEVEYGSDSITLLGRPLHGIDVNMQNISDTVQTLAAVALFAEGATTVHGVANMRIKETDRLVALACELRKLGATVEEYDDGLQIEPGPLHGAELDTYDDHRMAMSLAVVGLATEGVIIRDPDCTRKTYPDFFRDLAQLSSHGK